MLETSDFAHGSAMWSLSCDEWELPKWAWWGSREQFLQCGLRTFRQSKSSVYRWYTRLNVVGLFTTLETMGADSSAVIVDCTLSITHGLRLNLQLHTIDLVRTCCISSFCTVAWQLARFQLTRRIAQSLGDSWASCYSLMKVEEEVIQRNYIKVVVG